MKFSEMTDAELLEIRDSANSAVNSADAPSARDVYNLTLVNIRLMERGYQWRNSRLVPPPPEAPGL